MYLGTSVDGYWWDENGEWTGLWTREHIWPQSLLGEKAGGINIASDLHNLKPAASSTNSSRGNKWFANTTTTVSYAPRDAVKGDIARILFYMVVMYDYLTLIETDSVEPVVHEMGDLSTITSWLTLDTVDDFERNRNETIFGIQYNRNPFIDYPYFYQMIYEV